MRIQTSLLPTLPSLALLWAAGAWPAFSQTSPIYAWTTLAGQPGGPGNADGTGSAARFYDPCGVAVDSAGNVFVADTGQQHDPEGDPGGGGDDAGGQRGGFRQRRMARAARRGFTILPAWRWTARATCSWRTTDNHTIRKVTPAGVVTTLAGSAGTSGSADGTGSAARFNYPAGVAVDSAGNVFVADSWQLHDSEGDPGGGGDDAGGQRGAFWQCGWHGQRGAVLLSWGVAVDSAGNVFVADSCNNTIRKVTPAGVVTTLAGMRGLAAARMARAARRGSTILTAWRWTARATCLWRTPATTRSGR